MSKTAAPAGSRVRTSNGNAATVAASMSQEGDKDDAHRRFDENGLVLPRKLVNPNIGSSQKKEMHREMLWRMKFGPAEDAKSTELAKVYSQFANRQKIKEQEASAPLTFEKVLEEQRQRLHSIQQQQQQQQQQQPASNTSHGNDSEHHASGVETFVEPTLDKAANEELARVFYKVRSKSVAGGAAHQANAS